MASNPQLNYSLVSNTWNLVSTNITDGLLHILKGNIIYYHTYRLTGDPAPSNTPIPGDNDFEGVMIDIITYTLHNTEVTIGTATINATDAIDVYIYPYDPYEPHTKIGKIRIDAGT